MTHRRMLAVVLMAATHGCGETAAPGPGLVLQGRLERGATVQALLLSGQDSVPLGGEAMTFKPADAARRLEDGRVQLLRAGRLTVAVTVSGGAAGVTVEVQPPPSLVFDMLAAGNRDVYRVALDGGDLERLTSQAGDDAEPTAAPGSAVVFVSRRDGNAELYSVSRDGGTPARLTTTGANETHPTLSPDGQMLAFTRDDEGVPRVWRATASGGGARRLTESFGFAGSIEMQPSWAWRSDSLVFTATAHGAANLYVVMASGGRPPAPLVSPGNDSVRVEGAWSPDGRHVAHAVATPGGPSRLAVLDVATGKVTRLAGDRIAGQPAWLPDGRLLFTRFGTHGSELCWIDPANPGEVNVIPISGGADARNPHALP